MTTSGMGPRATPLAGPRWPVAAVARRLGVAPATLRTWDRRYGLGPSDHVAGAHRRYTASDLARLDTMRRLTLAGLPPAEAARAALATREAEPDVAAVADAEPLPDREGGLAGGRGGPGGRVLAVPGADAAVRGLSRAVLALDASTTTAALRALVAERGVLPTWDGVLRPLLVAVGARWAGTGEGVEAEHLLSECATTVLREVSAAISEPPDTRPVLLACAPDDLHVLPLHAMAAGLAERGIAARVLGAALPADALAAAVRRTGPAALLLWSQLPSTAAADVLAALPVTRPATVLLAGGPGWQGVELPRRVTVARDLSHALSLVDRALGAA